MKLGRQAIAFVWMLLMFCFFVCPMAAQQTKPIAPYTTKQAADGQAVYEAKCSSCHLSNLIGAFEAPALIGPNFMSRWDSRTTKDLYTFIRTSMPPNSPNTLSKQEAASLVAYILLMNGATAGPRALTPTTGIRIGAVATGQVPAKLPFTPVRFVGQLQGRVLSGITVAGKVKNYVPVTDEMLRHPPPGDWLIMRGNDQGWMHSPLTQINTHDVQNLQLAWAWAMNEGGGANETQPLVHDGIIYLANTDNTVQALDGRTGNLIWENHVRPSGTQGGGNDGRNGRNLAIYGNKIFFATTDGRLAALDARTGKTIWETPLANTLLGDYLSSGPIVVHGKVIEGEAGCDHYEANPKNQGCFITALDANTGKVVWRFNTIPRPGEPGGNTWGKLPYMFRAGVDTWITGTYDPTLNLTYWGVAQAKPWMRVSRGTSGKALYSSCTLALNPDTGKLVWYFQHVPGESLDMDSVYTRVLVNAGGQKLALTIGKDGILWKLNRQNGKFLGLTETVFQNIFSRVNPVTGQVTYRNDIVHQQIGKWIQFCPGSEGGHNWQAVSYDPGTQELIIPLSQSCNELRALKVAFVAGSGGTAGERRFFEMPGTDGNLGRLSAYNVNTLKQVWSWQQPAPFMTAVLSTGGGLAFVGDINRTFRAVDVKTGKTLWRTRLATSVQGYPVAFSIAGKEYIAVTTGLGGGSPRNAPDLLLPIHYPNHGNALYVFALPKDN